MVGIYIIKNLVNNKFYIGSTNCFRKRVNQHKSELNRNNHHNLKLQRSVNKYGLENFEFTLFEETEYENLLSREQYWINLLNPEYNLSKLVGGHNRKATTEDTRAKISASKDKYKKEVYQFDMQGNFIEKYESLSAAMRAVNTNTISHICQCCKGNRAYAYNYLWSYNDTPTIIKKKYYEIKQYDLQNNLIKSWKGCNEIARFYNLPKHIVRGYIYGQYNTKNKELEKYLWEILK